jgi:hypothetical protein
MTTLARYEVALFWQPEHGDSCVWRKALGVRAEHALDDGYAVYAAGSRDACEAALRLLAPPVEVDP